MKSLGYFYVERNYGFYLKMDDYKIKWPTLSDLDKLNDKVLRSHFSITLVIIFLKYFFFKLDIFGNSRLETRKV